MCQVHVEKYLLSTLHNTPLTICSVTGYQVNADLGVTLKPQQAPTHIRKGPNHTDKHPQTCPHGVWVCMGINGGFSMTPDLG